MTFDLCFLSLGLNSGLSLIFGDEITFVLFECIVLLKLEKINSKAINVKIEYLNFIHKNVGESINANARKYHVHMALTRTLNEKLREIAQVIQEQNYTPEQYDPQFGALKGNNTASDGAFILFYLK